MKNFNMGQKSPSYNCAQKITNLALTLLIISTLGFGAKANPNTSTSECPPVTVTQLSNNDWFVTVHLSCAIGSGEVSTTSQFPGQPGFDGFFDETIPASNGMSITYHLSGPHPSLPSGTDVAIITLTDDECGEIHTWQVSTDGSGTMLILDEF